MSVEPLETCGGVGRTEMERKINDARQPDRASIPRIG